MKNGQNKINMFATITLIVAAVSTALMAGLFFSWSVSVVPGLARVNDHEYIAAFQAMNRAILNPVFLLCFMGTAIALPLATWMQYQLGSGIRFWCLVVASALYLIGVMGVTIFGNVPMNEGLDVFRLSSATPQEIAEVRLRFETPWNRLNMVRTICSVTAIIFVVIGCIARNDSE